MKRRPRCKRIAVAPYNRTVFLYTDREEWARAVVRVLDYTIDEARHDAAFHGVTSWEENKAREIYVGVFDRSLGTLAHEMTHAASVLLETVGVPFHTMETNETIAYLVGYLVDEGAKFIKGNP